MKTLTLFYLAACPHCKLALKFIDEVKAERTDLANVEIAMVEESKDPTTAEQYDYYYVPTFYLGEKKLHEGHAEKADVLAVLETAAQA